jgi:uncharacterized protein YkwD
VCLLLLPTAAFSHAGKEFERWEEPTLTLVNAARAAHGLPPLRNNAQLSRMAREHSQRMFSVDFFDHTDPFRGSLGARARAFGVDYDRLGENIAFNSGMADPVAVAVKGWLQSPGHRANLLSEQYSESGIGIWRHGESFWFTHIFRAPAEPAQASRADPAE